MFLTVPRDLTRGLLIDNPVFYLYDSHDAPPKTPVLAVEAIGTEDGPDGWITELLTFSIRQMMFVSGETAEASVDTTSMIEEIVHAQVVEMVST